MKIVRLLMLLAAMIAAALLIGFLKFGLGRLFHQSFWLGTAAALACMGVCFVIVVWRSRTTALRSQSASLAPLSPQGEDLLGKFPAPVTLNGSRAKWLLMTVLGAGMTAASTFVGILAFAGLHAGQAGAGIGLAMSVLGTCFFGLCIVKAVRLLRHPSLLLDLDGFEFFGLFRRRYQWSEVSDFGVFQHKGNASVVFKTTKPDRNYWSRMNAYMAGGRDGQLSGTYGLRAEELVQLMTAWQSVAIAKRGGRSARVSRPMVGGFDPASA
ncbi:hypothetical protein JQ604_02410 [Bradyrhizobium jicamae]|uniref:hypothetical protein n=1 Tax=Bradyrhizobium jicamae TaxID=280332 RepID=UPI001BACF7D9|nr:hypothetical protein [Bradyrhizobium jicamae]MBR0751021.1 hypothetical protein [Bradyrhizobium jicamae]